MRSCVLAVVLVILAGGCGPEEPISLVLVKASAIDLRPNMDIEVLCTVDFTNRTNKMATLSQIDVVVFSPEGEELTRKYYIPPDSCSGGPHPFSLFAGVSSSQELRFQIPALPDGTKEVRVQIASRMEDQPGPASKPIEVRVQLGPWRSMTLHARKGREIPIGASLDRADSARQLVPYLEHEDPGIRASAALWLGWIGPWAKEAIPALTKARDDSDAEVRKFSTGAIDKILEKAPPKAS